LMPLLDEKMLLAKAEGLKSRATFNICLSPH
jgi:hypothetical protein